MEDIVRYICEQYFKITNKKIDELRLVKINQYFLQKDVIKLTGKPLFKEKYMLKYNCVKRLERYLKKRSNYKYKLRDIDYELKYIILNVITKYVNYSSGFIFAYIMKMLGRKLELEKMML